MANEPPPHDLEQELSHLRQLRDAVLDVLRDVRLTAEQKLEAVTEPVPPKRSRSVRAA